MSKFRYQFSSLFIMHNKGLIRPLIFPKPSAHVQKEDITSHCAKLERIVHDQNEEIENLKQKIQEQREKNAEIQKKINEMNEFLEEYDLHWVGGPGPKEKTYENGPDDMETFMQRVKKLNSDAESIKPQLVQENNITKINHEKPVLVTLFNKHFTINEGTERPYSDPASVQFFRDIYDGFYPEEFREQYPDGFVMKIVDKREEDKFKGQARKIENDPVKEKANDNKYTPDTNGEYGEGDGKLHIRLPIGNKILKTNPQMIMREIRRFIRNTFNIDEFEVVDTFKNFPYDDNANLKSLGLYPKGVVNVNLPSN